jgi:hypothetical protein
MNQEYWNKVLKGAAIAAAGAVLTYLATSVVPQLHENAGAIGPALAALFSIAIQFGRKWIESQSEQKQ